MSSLSAAIRTGLPETFGPRETALALAAFSVLALASALALEHIGGFRPCHLCLQERIPYYAAVPLAVAAFLLARPWPAATRALLAVITLAFVYNAGLGTYHCGVEWGWWPGPDSCTGLGTIASNPQDLMKSLAQGGGVVVRCDEAPLRILGLSLAGYGVLLSVFLAFLAGAGACGVDLAARLRTVSQPGHGGFGQETR